MEVGNAFITTDISSMITRAEDKLGLTSGNNNDEDEAIVEVAIALLERRRMLERARDNPDIKVPALRDMVGETVRELLGKPISSDEAYTPSDSAFKIIHHGQPSVDWR